MANKKTFGHRPDISDRGTLHRSDSYLSPTLYQKRYAFCYVAKREDIIILDRENTRWLLLMPAILIALGTSIAAYRVSNLPHSMSIVLLMLPVLQLLATSAVWIWVRQWSRPHVWVRGYSPRRSKANQSVRPDSKRDRKCQLPSRGDTQSLMNPTKVVVHVMERNGMFQVFQLFAKSIGQPRESSHERTRISKKSEIQTVPLPECGVPPYES
jgi:hypothetical protein